MTLPDGPAAPDPARSRPEDEELTRRIAELRLYLLDIAGRELPPEVRTKEGDSDLVQDTMMEAHRDRSGFHGESEREVRSWLRRILHNNAHNAARKYRTSRRDVAREVPLAPGDDPAPDPAAPVASPSAEAVRKEELERLDLALARLDARDRQVITCRAFEDLSFEAIGRILGGNADMARKAWERAMDRLRAELEGPGPGPSRRAPS